MQVKMEDKKLILAKSQTIQNGRATSERLDQPSLLWNADDQNLGQESSNLQVTHF